MSNLFGWRMSRWSAWGRSFPRALASHEFMTGVCSAASSSWIARAVLACAPKAYGPHKALYNLLARWSEMGVFVRMMEGLAAADTVPKTVIIILRRTDGIGSAAKRRLIGRTKGSMNTKLYAATDANGRPLSFFMSAGQVSDYTGAAALSDDLLEAQWLLGDCGYDVD